MDFPIDFHHFTIYRHSQPAPWIQVASFQRSSGRSASAGWDQGAFRPQAARATGASRDRTWSNFTWDTLVGCPLVSNIYIYIPIGSMYAIYGNIYHQYTPNVRIYTIHGSYGIYIYVLSKLPQVKLWQARLHAWHIWVDVVRFRTFIKGMGWDIIYICVCENVILYIM